MKFKRGLAQVRACSRLVGMKDKALIVLLIILLGQSTYVLFTGDAVGGNAGSIDLMVRTTSAAIFGYFLSANFLTKNFKSPNNCNTPDVQMMRIMSKSEKKDDAITEESKERKQQVGRESNNHCNAQIFIAIILAIYALAVLIIARDIVDESINSIATLAQFRDFVSGCVGFLVGSPINRGSK